MTRDAHLATEKHANQDWQKMARPVMEGPFVRPAAEAIAQPIWGHRDGLRVSLYPLGGPRGLIRLYAPYLGHTEYRVINYIAIEPIAQGEQVRGLSEMEQSELDTAPGKRFWAADTPDDTTPRMAEDHPARGMICREGDVQILQVCVMCEPFRNGAHPYVQLTFRSDRPYEVGMAAFACKDSKPMANCVLSATMGNFARLRQLHLAERIVTSHEIWPDYKEDRFARRKAFGLPELCRTADGHVLVAATPDEEDPSQVMEGFPKPHWQYVGRKATQYWRCETASPELRAQVNGRYAYWRSKEPIPGGISFENFELFEPFQEGHQFWFGVTLQTPEQLRTVPSVPAGATKPAAAAASQPASRPATRDPHLKDMGT